MKNVNIDSKSNINSKKQMNIKNGPSLKTKLKETINVFSSENEMKSENYNNNEGYIRIGIIKKDKTNSFEDEEKSEKNSIKSGCFDDNLGEYSDEDNDDEKISGSNVYCNNH